MLEKFQIQTVLNKGLPKVCHMVANGTVHWFMLLDLSFFFFYFNIRQCPMKENLDFHITLQIKRFSNAHAHITISWHSGYALKTGHTFSTSPQTQYPLLSLTLICMSNATPLRCRIFSTWLYGLFVLLLPIRTEAKSVVKNYYLKNCFWRC